MEQSDSFKTISGKGDVEIKIKGSRFVGHARPCATVQEAEDRLVQIRKKYHDATHNCYAYRVGQEKEKEMKFSDDGEPSGTAGKPIYDIIEGRDLTNILVVVTRYFGGTKLGTGGLVRAYGDAAQEAIKAAGTVERLITSPLVMTVEFPDYNLVERIIRQLGGNIVGADFQEKIGIKAEIRRSLLQRLKDDLIEATSGRIVIGG